MTVQIRLIKKLQTKLQETYHTILKYKNEIIFVPSFVFIRGCLHDNGATFIPGRDEKLHRVYIKPCLLGCESYSAVKLMKF